MANLGKGKEGYLFIGVTDTEEDTKRVEKLDNINAPRFNSFGVVGLEREATLQGKSIDDYILFISRKIRNSELPEFLKTQINTSLLPINYMNYTVLKLTVKAGDSPVWYKEKLYIRDGHEKQPQEQSAEQINAVFSLFR
jgi:predicted HTH transcriptional regulator